jgi:phosphate-selective porin OprO/OprP
MRPTNTNWRNWIATLVLLAVAMAPTTPAVAQQITGLYYKEIEKDGRVYVFNTPERYKSWLESGEMGVAITLVGQGEGGKTLQAENETAADLYFFKHNLEGYERPTPKPYAPPFEVSWKDGKTTFKTKSGELSLSNRMQLRFTQELPQVGDDVGSFRIRRMKTKFDGWLYTKDLTYELQLNWPDTANPVEDVNVNVDLSRGKKAIQLKAGMFKVPFGRQELTSSGSQQFVDRSAVSNRFARGRDIGVQLWGQPAGGKIDWRVGLFNGNGRTVTRNDNDKYQFNARLTYQPWGDVKYSEGDFESSDRPLLAFSAQYEDNERFTPAAGTTAARSVAKEIVGGDVVFKVRGLSVFAEFFDASNDDATLSTPVRSTKFDDSGRSIQVGYFVLPKRLEIAARLAEIDPNGSRSGDEQEERGLGLGYFWNKHAHKLQADYRQIEDKARRVTNDEVRVQYQVIF